jgi:NlpC/P60 family putative phage cell wall peptidase
VYKDIFGQEPEIPPPYSPTWRETGKKEFMLDAARKHLVETDEIKPGVVLMFRMAPNVIVKHCGIMVTHDRMVHAYARSRKVIEHPLVAYWKNKIAGRFEFPLVNHVGD